MKIREESKRPGEGVDMAYRPGRASQEMLARLSFSGVRKKMFLVPDGAGGTRRVNGNDFLDWMKWSEDNTPVPFKEGGMLVGYYQPRKYPKWGCSTGFIGGPIVDGKPPAMFVTHVTGPLGETIQRHETLEAAEEAHAKAEAEFVELVREYEAGEYSLDRVYREVKDRLLPQAGRVGEVCEAVGVGTTHDRLTVTMECFLKVCEDHRTLLNLVEDYRKFAHAFAPKLCFEAKEALKSIDRAVNSLNYKEGVK